jgi:predicted Zn-dependent peptidase
MSEIRTHVFPNGFRVVYEKPANHMSISHIYAFCHVGSAHEDPSTRGASHFIEHMCFKGTPKFPTSRDIEIQYDIIGAHFNAHTEKQYTCYEVTCGDQYTEKCISILGNIMLNSVFNKKEYKKELNVVIEESVRNLTNYGNTVYDNLHALVFKGSIYENPIDALRYHKNADTLKYEDVVDFYREHYIPENMVLSITTSLPFSKILAIIKHADFIKRKKEAHPIFNTIPRMIVVPQQDVQLHCEDVAKMKSVYLTIGFRTCPLYHPDYYVLKFLQNLIGGMFTSRLFTLLREKNGLTYQSSISTTFYENAGVFVFYAITDTKKLMHNGTSSKKGVLPLIVGLLNDLVKHGVTQEEVTKTKQNLKGKTANMLENANSQSYYNGLRVLLHNEDREMVPFKDLYSTHYAKITKAYANAVIQKYFRRDAMNVALVGGGIPSKPLLMKSLNEFTHA